MIAANSYLPTNDLQVPTGEIRAVENTAFDLRAMTPLRRQLEGEKIGYDHNFCIDEGTQGAFATAYDPESGRVMEVTTDMPGVQLYTGNFLDKIPGKGGTLMNKYAGFCLETQFYPDSPNQPNFPSCIFKAGEKFRSRTSFKFSVK